LFAVSGQWKLQRSSRLRELGFGDGFELSKIFTNKGKSYEWAELKSWHQKSGIEV
jgi:hypothetical protein